MQFLDAAFRVAKRRFIEFSGRERPLWRLPFIAFEFLGAMLSGVGILSTLMFLSADTPAQAQVGALAKFPSACEAGFYSGGKYICWYAIQGHLFLFLLSLAVLATGAAIMKWAQRFW
jgi:hypothetical protein